MSLGGMYFLGRGVPRDYVQAHLWFNLASAKGDKTAAKLRDMVAKIMSPADVSKAQRLARQWQLGQQPAKASKPHSSISIAVDKCVAVGRVQRGLTVLGYDPGPADGILGPKTRTAIRAFQAREKLSVTGVISEELEAALQSVSGAGQARKAEQ